MTEVIELGPRSQGRHTASRSLTEAHARAAWRASRVRAEATSSRCVRSGPGHKVSWPRSALAEAGRPTMKLDVTWARRCAEDDDVVMRLRVGRAKVPESSCHTGLSGQNDLLINGWVPAACRGLYGCPHTQ
jgi:hypothetical protein